MKFYDDKGFIRDLLDKLGITMSERAKNVLRDLHRVMNGSEEDIVSSELHVLGKEDEGLNSNPLDVYRVAMGLTLAHAIVTKLPDERENEMLTLEILDVVRYILRKWDVNLVISGKDVGQNVKIEHLRQQEHSSNMMRETSYN